MYKTEFTKQMENEFGNFNEIPKHFRSTLNDLPTNQEMFIYIKNHFRYYTMNSWNRCKSFANNVKIYNLNFTKEQQENYHEIISENFNDLDRTVFNDNMFQILYLFSTYYDNQYKINFNGSSGGYLVIYKSAKNLLGGQITTFPGKSIGDEFHNYDNLNDYLEEYHQDDLLYFFNLIYDFDLICDILRYNVGLELDCKIEEYEIPQPVIIKKRFKSQE